MNKVIKRPHLPVGTKPVFDKIVDRKILESSVLNVAHRSKDDDMSFLDFNDPRELKRLMDRSEVEKIKIEKSIATLNSRWQGYQSRKVDEGKAAPGSKYLPNEEESEKLYRFEASLYVTQKEVEHLEKLLVKSLEKVSVTSNKNILKYGVKGVGRILGGSLILLDGQPIVKAKDGSLVISCEESPYNGIATFDYLNQVVKPFGIMQSKIKHKQEELARKLLDAGVGQEAVKVETDKLEKRFMEENPNEVMKMIKWRNKMVPDPKGIPLHELINNEKQFVRTK